MSLVGEKIKQRRLEANISVAELSRNVDISRGYLHSIENGETQNPSADVLFKIAQALDTTIADLLGHEEDLPDIEISDSLREFAKQKQLSNTDIEMLARVRYRGKKPKTVEDWDFIFGAIKRTLR